MSVLKGKRVLITGGTGSIGSEVVRRLLFREPELLVILSRDDSKHFYFQQELGDRNDVTFIIGDVRDRESLSRAFQLNIDVVIHAAALKHVLICEQNPTEAIKTNILGTQNVIDLAKENGVEIVLMVSTDKAVNPTSTMGASKYVAEKLTIDGNTNGETKCACVRFGNVLGSRGSVIPTLVKGIKERGSIWISDENVTRFAIPIPEAADLVLDSLEYCQGGEIFVLKMNSFSLSQLIRVISRMEIAAGGFDIDVRGLIRAEKLHEDLVTSDELARLYETDTHYIIAPPVGEWMPTDDMMVSDMAQYNSSDAEFFTDEVLTSHVQDCIAMMDLD